MNPPIQPGGFLVNDDRRNGTARLWKTKRQNSIRAHVGAWAMKNYFSQMKDERILAFYENVRQQVENDKILGGGYRFTAEGLKRYAERLREEMDRRRLRYIQIDWS
jgi:hypothetical protein